MEIASLILSATAFGFSLYCFIDVMAQKKSTHKIQFIDPSVGLKPVDLDKGVAEEFRDFDIPDPAELALKEMNKNKNKDLQ